MLMCHNNNNRYKTSNIHFYFCPANPQLCVLASDKKGSMDILMGVTFIQVWLTSFYQLNFFSKVISNNNIKTDLFLWRNITFTGVVHFPQCLGYNKLYNEFKLSFVLVYPNYYNTYHKVRFLKIDILCFYHTEW